MSSEKNTDLDNFLLSVLQTPETFFELFNNTTVAFTTTDFEPIDFKWQDESKTLNPAFFFGGIVNSNVTIPMKIFKHGLMTSQFAGAGVFPGEYTINILDSFTGPSTFPDNKLFIGVQMNIEVPLQVDNIVINVEPAAILNFTGYLQFIDFPESATEAFFEQYPSASKQCSKNSFQPSIVCPTQDSCVSSSSSNDTLLWITMSVAIIAIIVALLLYTRRN